jgi:hypothetical protein
MNGQQQISNAAEPHARPLTKSAAAAALEHAYAAAKLSAVRILIAVGVGVLVNAVFLSSVQRAALDARTPDGQVTIADLESAPHEYAAAKVLD